jgi:hypothetical protein
LKKKMRIYKHRGENTRQNRMKKSPQLHDSLIKCGDRTNSFWLLRSRHMNRITRK